MLTRLWPHAAPTCPHTTPHTAPYTPVLCIGVHTVACPCACVLQSNRVGAVNSPHMHYNMRVARDVVSQYTLIAVPNLVYECHVTRTMLALVCTACA